MISISISARNLVSAVVFLSLAGMVAAESLSAKAFSFDRGRLDYPDRGEVYAAWNASDPQLVLKPGMKVLFFGRAEGCDIRAAGGPVKHEGNARFNQAMALTGVPAAPPGKGEKWTPSAESDSCDLSVRGEVGDTFVHLNRDPEQGGIGIFTFTGSEPTGKKGSFFRPFDARGKGGNGANANIEGTFVAFRFDWQKGNTVRPWAGGQETADQRAAELKTSQSVVAASVPAGGKDKPIQVKQQVIVAFINPTCFREGKDRKKSMCQVQYLFNVAVLRAGVSDWSKVGWFKDAGVFFDPAQGGMPVVHGPLGRNGETSRDHKWDLDLYTSLGAPSQHSVFNDETFHARISFKQLKNTLRLVAAESLKKPAGDVGSGDLSSVFGPKWDDPNEWALLSANVSQEVFNPYSEAAFIGGSVKGLAFGAGPL